MSFLIWFVEDESHKSFFLKGHIFVFLSLFRQSIAQPPLAVHNSLVERKAFCENLLIYLSLSNLAISLES